MDKYSKIVQNAWYIHQDNTNYIVIYHILVLFKFLFWSSYRWPKWCKTRRSSKRLYVYVSNVNSSLLWMNILVKIQGINNVKTHKSFASSPPVVCYCLTSKHARLLIALRTC